jgi:hypothetical protein
VIVHVEYTSTPPARSMRTALQRKARWYCTAHFISVAHAVCTMRGRRPSAEQGGSSNTQSKEAGGSARAGTPDTAFELETAPTPDTARVPETARVRESAAIAVVSARTHSTR